MTLELSPLGIVILILFVYAPEVFYFPVALAAWLVDAVLDLVFGKRGAK